MKKLINILFISFLLSSSIKAQVEFDSCQCQLMFGNWYNPTLVTYHNDSFVTYQYALYPLEKVMKLLKSNRKINRDTIFGKNDYYYYADNSRTFSIRNGDIGKKVNEYFYTDLPLEIKDSGTASKTFWIEKGGHLDSLIGFPEKLFLSIIKRYEKPIKINGKTSNCYKYSDPYYFTGEFTKIDLKPEFVNGLKFYETFDETMDSPAFVVKDHICTMIIDHHKTCYLLGIGEVVVAVNYSEPFPINVRRKIIYLTPTCKKYLFEKFGYLPIDN